MMFRRAIVVGAALAIAAAAGSLGSWADMAWAQNAKQFPSETYNPNQFPSETYSGGPQPRLERQFPDDQWQGDDRAQFPDNEWEERGVGINPGRSHRERGTGAGPH